jgi:hypothetical protein
MTEAHITDLIVERIVAILIEELQDPYDTDDATYAEVLREGLLQENPLANRISVTVHMGDPDEVDQDAWIDEVAEDGDPVIPNLPMFEIGRPEVGGIHFWRRGTVKADVFLIKTKENRDEARRIANIIRGRIEKALWSRGEDFQGISDSYGEQTILLQLMKSYAREGGGPGQKIWRAYVWWQALTSRS